MPLERVVGMARNGWTASVGIAGRHGPDYAPRRAAERRDALATPAPTHRYRSGRPRHRAIDHYQKEQRRRTDLAAAGKTRDVKGDAPLDAARDTSSIAGKTTQANFDSRAAGAAQRLALQPHAERSGACRLKRLLARLPKPTQPFCPVKYIISRKCNNFTPHQKETHARA
jgi:hypothetical protein